MVDEWVRARTPACQPVWRLALPRTDLRYWGLWLMDESCAISVNGRLMQVVAGTSVAAAMLMAGEACRLSVQGEPRAALCGMGICMECRATVNGVRHARTCQVTCTAGMEVMTG